METLFSQSCWPSDLKLKFIRLGFSRKAELQKRKGSSFSNVSRKRRVLNLFVIEIIYRKILK